MITNDLQNRIHFGDREAFLAVYHEYGPGVYTFAKKALASDSLAKNAVRQTFLTLYDELLTKSEDFDIPVRIRQLADHEIYLLQMIDGKPAAQEGRFRLRGVANGTPNGPGVEWSANNTYGRGAGATTAAGAGNTRDEEQVITLTAIYKMNQ